MYSTMAKTKLILGQTDLATINPTLSMEWHPEKNTGLTPMQVTAGSMKKVWWQCEKGHEWQATVYARNHGTGCPVCNNHTRHRLTLGKNDLATVNPALAAELHPVKNGDLTAQDLTAQSNQKVWWLCKHGHEWQTAVFLRTRGTGCPICAHTKPVQRPVIPLSEDSTLSAQWHPSLNGALSPEMISATSKEKVWWQCEYGHAWQASVHSRKARGTGCPYCAKRRVKPGENDLLTLNPELAAQWHPTKNGTTSASDVTLHSNFKAWWLCAHGHEWSAIVANRASGQGCPTCFRLGFCALEDSIQISHPSLAAEWHPSKNAPLTPDKVSSSSSFEAWWQCDKGHVWQASIASRLKKTGKCPICNPRQSRKATPFTCLSAVNPTLAAEWHPTKNAGLSPDDVLPYSNMKVWWQCKNGHEWKAVIASRSQGTGCPHCPQKRTVKILIPLSEHNPTLAAQWHPTKNGTRTPADVAAFCNDKAWWLCAQGHEWEAHISSRSQGAGCPFCSNRKVLAGYNDLATVNPALAEEWHPTKNGDLLPQAVSPGNHRTVWWQCKNGHEWKATIYNRNKGSSCPYCAQDKGSSE